MNKQELIKKYEGEFPSIGMNLSTAIKFKKLWVDILELDEQQKQVVPQFVADYIKDAKYYEWDLDDVFDHIAEESEESEIYEWFYMLGNVDVFARAWLDGYTVEKEKRYRVKMKGHIQENILVYGYGVKRYFLSSNLVGNRRAEHTKKQLEEDGFSEVFNNPLFEVEEVE